MTDDVTPIRQQYLEIKRQYPDAILFFRLGDFYETFDEDAETTSRELDIVLTSRNVAKGARIPMAGIPFHAAENYLVRLIERGYHVAICEQVGIQPVKGLFPRQVVRVVTPGTVIEPGLLKGDQNNYLAAILLEENDASLAYVDITTGEFAATEFSGKDAPIRLRAEISRLNPSEILVTENAGKLEGIQTNTTSWPAWHFETGRCQDVLKNHFKVASLDGFGLRGQPKSIRAAGAILQYLQATQPSCLGLLTSVLTYSLDDFMTLDAATRRNLELTETLRQSSVYGSLLGVLDHTVTPMGKRLIRQWVSKPQLDRSVILKRQNSVAGLVENGLLRAELRTALHPLADMERLGNRIVANIAIPRDLVALRTTLSNLPPILSLLNNHENPLFPWMQSFHPCDHELAILQQSISDDPPATLQNTGVIRPGYSQELDQVIEASQKARDWINDLENIERDRSGIKSLKVGYNKVFGYFIEVTHSNSNQVPSDYIRKQTLVNAERYITPEMKEYEALVLNAEERIHEIETRLFKEICSKIASNIQGLLETARTLGEMDVLCALAEAAVAGRYCRPELVDESILEIRDGRHPVVEKSLAGERFVPNDSVFETGEIIRIITGPNMSGKSTFLRQVALIVIMAQMGSFVPASSARLGIVDRIFTRIGAQDEIHAGQSTFMVEMIETANILHHATPRSLLVLDEIGRGTSTYDGLSIAWAVIEFIHNHPRLRAKTLFATHYHELIQLSQFLPGIRNYNVAVTEADDKVVFLHKIVPGGSDRSYGIHVARLAGLPLPVIQRANQILEELESTTGRAGQIDPTLPKQMALFPETNQMLDELRTLDINSLSPIEALNRLYEWQRKYTKSD